MLTDKWSLFGADTPHTHIHQTNQSMKLAAA